MTEFGSSSANIPRQQITALILAGGQARRMGGVAKGLQLLAERPLVAHIAEKIRPAVGPLWISANQHQADYANYADRVIADLNFDYAGPLAAWQAGLSVCATPWLLSLPCDCPDFPADLCQRLSAAAQQHPARLSYACATELHQSRAHPVFALIHRQHLRALNDYLISGQRRVMSWLESQQACPVLFEDNSAFENLNTLEQLQQKNQSYDKRST